MILEIQEAEDSSNLATEIGPNPYKGLQAFDENDRISFFGRLTEIKILREKVYNLYRQESNFPFVTGLRSFWFW